jgi:plastocyanin
MMTLVLNSVVTAFDTASVGLSALRNRRRRASAVTRQGKKAILGVAAAALFVGSVAGAAADEMAGMSMEMPGMPGMKMNATPVDVAPTEPNAVNINNFAFSPKELTVAAGTTVTWTNKDEEPHTVVNAASPPAFKSAALDGGDKFSFTFTKPGTYRYFCSVHPFMVATVVVK